jgi:hypothetical protein
MLLVNLKKSVHSTKVFQYQIVLITRLKRIINFTILQTKTQYKQ